MNCKIIVTFYNNFSIKQKKELSNVFTHRTTLLNTLIPDN